jgi:hypothetical protein
VANDMQVWRLRNRRRRLNERLREELSRSVPDPVAILTLRQRERNAERELLLAEAAPG